MRVVLDTNVVFEGLTTQGGASGLIIDLWRVNLLEVYVSTTLAFEYQKSAHDNYPLHAGIVYSLCLVPCWIGRIMLRFTIPGGLCHLILVTII
jgi:hypothetical protein